MEVIALSRDDRLPKFEVLNHVNVYRIQSRRVNDKGLFTHRADAVVNTAAMHRKRTPACILLVCDGAVARGERSSRHFQLRSES